MIIFLFAYINVLLIHMMDYETDSSMHSDLSGGAKKKRVRRRGVRRSAKKSPHRSKRRTMKRRVFDPKKHTRVKTSRGRLGRLVSKKRHSLGKEYNPYFTKMLHAKRNKIERFSYNGNQYKRKKNTKFANGKGYVY